MVCTVFLYPSCDTSLSSSASTIGSGKLSAKPNRLIVTVLRMTVGNQ